MFFIHNCMFFGERFFLGQVKAALCRLFGPEGLALGRTEAREVPWQSWASECLYEVMTFIMHAVSPQILSRPRKSKPKLVF